MAELDDAEVFLSKPKVAVGTAAWQEGTRPGTLQVEWPLHIEGESTGGRLLVSTAGGAKLNRFTAVVLLGKCLARLEFDPTASHINPMRGPKGVPRGRIDGSHYHVLQDNRKLAERGMVPKELKYARPLPTDLADFRRCLRWFCDLNVIELHDSQMPSDPPQPRLL